jgi:hypothetical protein
MRALMIRVVSAESGARGDFGTGLCGAAVVGLYVRVVNGQRRGKSRLCPACKDAI